MLACLDAILPHSLFCLECTVGMKWHERCTLLNIQFVLLSSRGGQKKEDWKRPRVLLYEVCLQDPYRTHFGLCTIISITSQVYMAAPFETITRKMN